jgi:hypothetical protein
MKRLILVFFLFSGLMAKSQCDTMTNATFSSITPTSCIVTIVSPGAYLTNWTGFAVTLYDSLTSSVAFQTFVTSKTFTATGLSPNRTYQLGVITYLNTTFCSPTVFNKYVRTISASISYTPMIANGYAFKRISVDSTFHVPLQDTFLNRGVLRAGAIVHRPQDSSFWGWNGRKWGLIGGASAADLALKENLSNKVTTITSPNATDYPSTAAVNGFVASSVSGKVDKWERWADTFFIQKYDTSKTALTIRVDTNITSKPTFQILDSINRPLFEMRAGNKRFDAENIFFGIGSGQKLRPIRFNSATYGVITGGSINTAFGNHALENAVDANENAAFGVYALQNLIGGNGGDPLLYGAINTALGAWAGRSMTIGTGNVLVGQKAGNLITTGGYNVIMGKSAGAGVRVGSQNVMIGSQSGLLADSTAIFNTWLGSGTGYDNKGSYSILIGAGSGSRYNTDKELVAGDSTVTPINDLWFGKGKYSGMPTPYTIHGTTGWGANVSGGDINIAGGVATGDGISGKINLQVSKKFFAGTNTESLLVNAATVASLPNSIFAGMGINTTTPTNALTVIHPQTNRTINDTVAFIGNNGSSYIVAGGSKSSTALQVESKSTNASGTGILTNTGLRAKAVNGNVNIAIAADSGSVVVGDTTTNFKFEVKGGVSKFGSRILGTTLSLNKDSLPVSQSNSVILQLDTLTGMFTKLGDTVKIGSASNAGKLSMKITNTSGNTLISRVSGATVINGGNYNSNSAQFLMFDNNADNTLEMINSVVGAKRFYIGVNPYIGGSVVQINGSQVIGGAGTNYFAPTNGLTVWGKTLIGSNTDANSGQLQVTGGISATSRYTGTSLRLNKDSLPFTTAASKLMLIDTVTGLATKANIGAGLSLTSGTLSATTSVFGGSVSTAVTSVTTFQINPPAQANANYQVVVTANNALTAGTMYYINNKTTANFEVVFLSPITGTVSFDWILKP